MRSAPYTATYTCEPTIENMRANHEAYEKARCKTCDGTGKVRIEILGPVRPKSAFAQRLENDPELAKRCEEIVSAHCEAAREHIEAIERSTQLTGDDYSIIVY